MNDNKFGWGRIRESELESLILSDMVLELVDRWSRSWETQERRDTEMRRHGDEEPRNGMIAWCGDSMESFVRMEDQMLSEGKWHVFVLYCLRDVVQVCVIRIPEIVNVNWGLSLVCPWQLHKQSVLFWIFSHFASCCSKILLHFFFLSTLVTFIYYAEMRRLCTVW